MWVYIWDLRQLGGVIWLSTPGIRGGRVGQMLLAVSLWDPGKTFEKKPSSLRVETHSAVGMVELDWCRCSWGIWDRPNFPLRDNIVYSQPGNSFTYKEKVSRADILQLVETDGRPSWVRLCWSFPPAKREFPSAQKFWCDLLVCLAKQLFILFFL